MQAQGNGKFSISCIGALVFAFAFAFAFALRLFKHVFTCAFACVCVCAARVNQPYELFYSAGFTNFICSRSFTNNNACKENNRIIFLRLHTSPYFSI